MKVVVEVEVGELREREREFLGLSFFFEVDFFLEFRPRPLLLLLLLLTFWRVIAMSSSRPGATAAPEAEEASSPPPPSPPPAAAFSCASKNFRASARLASSTPSGNFQTSKKASPMFLFGAPPCNDTSRWTILAIVLTKPITSS